MKQGTLYYDRECGRYNFDYQQLPVTKIGRDYFTSRAAIQAFLTDNMGKELAV